LCVEVNGRTFEISGLHDNQALTMDIGAALRPGVANVVSITPLGKPGGSAVIVIPGRRYR